MENFTPEATEKKVPRMSFAVTSLVCGIFSLANGGVILGLLRAYPLGGVVIGLAAAVVSIGLPLVAVIFGAIPLKQGKGTDWDGKDMAKVGLLNGTISLAWITCCFLLFGILIPLMVQALE